MPRSVPLPPAPPPSPDNVAAIARRAVRRPAADVKHVLAGQRGLRALQRSVGHVCGAQVAWGWGGVGGGWGCKGA